MNKKTFHIYDSAPVSAMPFPACCFLMLLSFPYHGHLVVKCLLFFKAQLKYLPQIAPLACRKLTIISHFLKAGTMLTAEGDRMKKTAQTLHTAQHEGQPVTAISKCEPFTQSLALIFCWRRNHTLKHQEIRVKGLGPTISLVSMFSMA